MMLMMMQLRLDLSLILEGLNSDRDDIKCYHPYKVYFYYQNKQIIIDFLIFDKKYILINSRLFP